MSEEGVQRLVALFEQQVAEELHPGAQLVVLRHGQVVVDRAIGLADVKKKRPVTPDTPFLTFSVTKPIAGICLHRLIEEGKVAMDAPIATYWPEFGKAGKEEATIRHAFLHQAGIPTRGLNLQVLHWTSWARVTRNVAGLTAEYSPGSQIAYHLVNYGFIVGEVVRRVSGMPIDAYLRENFLEPMGLRNSWLGIPRHELARAARLYCGHPQQRNATILFSFPFIRGAVIPAATFNSTAREVAIFFQMMLNEGHYAGRRYLEPETLATATSLGAEGHDGIIGGVRRWGYGFELGGANPAIGLEPHEVGMGKKSSLRTFGHFGNATCMAWADWDTGLVVTFTCNRLLSSSDSRKRWRALSDAVWDSLKR
ncbi:MAG: beta-lactamase family protein [Ardenticatenales bacterium]|nr:beta-lactamase family protein [Ardenticatenales bacterium]